VSPSLTLYVIELTVYDIQLPRYFEILEDRCGGNRNLKRREAIFEGRIRRSRLLGYVLNTHMEEADYETLLKEKEKEYKSAKSLGWERYQKVGYRRQIWIKCGNTGIFVKA
jgi:hypothetical protein